MFFAKKETAAKPARAAPAPAKAAAAPVVSSRPGLPTDLKELAVQLNPKVGYYDPLNLGDASFWGQSNDATVGFLRHAEIKHGRVAMAAFVGYTLQANGVFFPWKLSNELSFKDIAEAGSPPDQWDALPTAAKVQILIFVGFLETWSETPSVLEAQGNAHYMRGGIPGKFPDFIVKEGQFPAQPDGWLPLNFGEQAFVPHPVPFNLWDPFKFNENKPREELDKSLLAEINNGRLAQLGIFSLLSAQKVPGSVPFLEPLVQPYNGEVMAAFSPKDAGNLPFVTTMLKTNPLDWGL